MCVIENLIDVDVEHLIDVCCRAPNVCYRAPNVCYRAPHSNSQDTVFFLFVKKKFQKYKDRTCQPCYRAPHPVVAEQETPA
jgi:hypothetical protein